MSRKWNWALWVGFLFVLLAGFSVQFFLQFPSTRDFPWVNLLLFAIGGIFLIAGLVRAFGRPQLYRGKIFGPIFIVIGLAFFGLFAYGMFYLVRQVPPSTSAPHVGQKAPDFALPDQNGKQVALADLLSPNGAVLIFYRGYW